MSAHFFAQVLPHMAFIDDKKQDSEGVQLIFKKNYFQGYY